MSRHDFTVEIFYTIGMCMWPNNNLVMSFHLAVKLFVVATKKIGHLLDCFGSRVSYNRYSITNR